MEARNVLGGDWAGTLLAAADVQTYNQLFGSVSAERATNDELADALESVLAEYVNG